MEFVAPAGGCRSKGQVTNWIDSGGRVPRLRSETIRKNTARSRAGWSKAPLRIGLAVLLSVAAAHPAQARDPDGRYANSPLKPWFDSLKSGKGPCCSDADGTAVSDVDWESGNGRYR